MLQIDGSLGEGGGQVLRTSLALSLVTGRAFFIRGIRAGRRNPGLRAQHLACVRSAAEVGDAEVTPAAIGSREMRFAPGKPRPGDYAFSVGTAGSAGLVLQTVLPALALADGPSTVRVEGGTHNAWAPPYEFLERSYCPAVGRMGPRIRIQLERHGFHPAGGGLVSAEIEPVAWLHPFQMLERGSIRERRARALVARLPRRIAEREISVLRERLGWEEECYSIEEVADSRGPGNAVVVEAGDGQVTEVFSAFGSKGVKAERVARDASAEVLRWLASGAPIGEQLTDQLMVFAALAGKATAWRTLPLTLHARTNLEVIRAFLEMETACEDHGDGTCTVRFGEG